MFEFVCGNEDERKIPAASRKMMAENIWPRRAPVPRAATWKRNQPWETPGGVGSGSGKNRNWESAAAVTLPRRRTPSLAKKQ
jgi:hypothetical protein